jgi:clan AA aspartic protease (TIGR02281 family)
MIDRTRARLIVGLVFTALTSLHAWSQETGPKVAGPPGPEEVLKKKGLRRSGHVYVLAAEDGVKRLDAKLALTFADWQRTTARLAQLANEVGELQQHVARLGQEHARRAAEVQTYLEKHAQKPAQQAAQRKTNPPPGNAEGEDTKSKGGEQREDEEGRKVYTVYLEVENRASEAQAQLFRTRSEYDRLASRGLQKEAEFQAQQLSLTFAADAVQKRYDDLGRDREVTKALLDLGKQENARFVLGPLENFKANAAKMRAEQLKEQGLRATRKGVVTDEDVNIGLAAKMTSRFEDELRDALRKQGQRPNKSYYEGQIAAGLKREKQLEDRVARAPSAAEKARLVAQLSGERAKNVRLKTDAGKAENLRKEAEEDVAAKRDAYVQSVVSLRDAVAKGKERREALKAPGKARPPALKPAPVLGPEVLKRAEASIQTEEVPLEQDKAAFWIVATLNGQAKKVIIDPSSDDVRLAAGFAAAVGVKWTDTAPTAKVTIDGRDLTAKRATLHSVEIGKAKVADVECLVFLDDYDAPPLFGTAFLNRFAYRFDPEKGKLLLNKVELKRK